MKTICKIMLFIILLSASSLAAAWKVDGGAGLWQGSADGTIIHQGNINIFGLTDTDQVLTDYLGDHSDKTAGYLYVTIKHPLPILPNIRFEYVGVKSGGELTYSTDLGFPIGVVEIGTESQFFLTQYDTILFYNLLENTFYMSFDLGVDVKYINTQYYVSELSVDETSSSIVPMVYLRGRVDAPFAPLGLESDIKYITDGESTVYDVRIKVDYTFEMNNVLTPGVELGYRMQAFKVYGEDSNYLGDILSGKSDTDVTFSGFYGGVTVKF